MDGLKAKEAQSWQQSRWGETTPTRGGADRARAQPGIVVSICV